MLSVRGPDNDFLHLEVVIVTESTLNLLTAYWPSVFWLSYK